MQTDATCNIHQWWELSTNNVASICMGCKGLRYDGRAVIKRQVPGYYERGPQLLSKENMRKIRPKETPSCLIPSLLCIYQATWHLSDNPVMETLLCSKEAQLNTVPALWYGHLDAMQVLSSVNNGIHFV